MTKVQWAGQTRTAVLLLLGRAPPFPPTRTHTHTQSGLSFSLSLFPVSSPASFFFLLFLSRCLPTRALFPSPPLHSFTSFFVVHPPPLTSLPPSSFFPAWCCVVPPRALQDHSTEAVAFFTLCVSACYCTGFRNWFCRVSVFFDRNIFRSRGSRMSPPIVLDASLNHHHKGSTLLTCNQCRGTRSLQNPAIDYIVLHGSHPLPLETHSQAVNAQLTTAPKLYNVNPLRTIKYPSW